MIKNSFFSGPHRTGAVVFALAVILQATILYQTYARRPAASITGSTTGEIVATLDRSLTKGRTQSQICEDYDIPASRCVSAGEPAKARVKIAIRPSTGG